MTDTKFTDFCRQALDHIEHHVRQHRCQERDIAHKDLAQQMYIDERVKVNALMRAQDLLQDTLQAMLLVQKPVVVTIAFNQKTLYTKKEQAVIQSGAQKAFREYHRKKNLDALLEKVGVHEALASSISLYVLSSPGEVRIFLQRSEKILLMPQLRLSGPQ